MIQHNQIGKYRTKESVLNAKIGGTYLLPSGKRYKFLSWEKQGRRYIYAIEYNGVKCRLSEVDFNTNMENVLQAMENEVSK